MIKKIKRIVIPMITTVLIAGSCMVVSAGTERDSITSGGLTMEYSVTATDHRASAGASVNTCSDLYVTGTAYKHLIGREPMNLGNSASQSYSVYAYVSSEYTYFEKIKATFGANSNDDDVVKAGLMATY
jgi:hypothetical protein